MFNYLYYKLYQASLKSSLHDTPEFMTAVSFGSSLSANVLIVSAFLAKVDILPFLFSSKGQAGAFAIIVIILTMVYYADLLGGGIASKNKFIHFYPYSKSSIFGA